MKRHTLIRSGCLVLAGGMAGFLLSAAYYGSAMKTMCLESSQSYLSQQIRHLAVLRSRDTGFALDEITEIEKSLDNSVIQLASKGMDSQRVFHPDRVSPGSLRALRLARVYSDAGYRQAFSEESLAVLDQVPPPPPDAEYCSPALRELQEHPGASE